jgi:cation diffusion facilitator family transporter
MAQSKASAAPAPPVNLTRYAWLSIGAAILTIGLKLTAYFLTNSVSLLSDALESLVNLVSAIVALIALSIAARPADDEFTFGYSKVEYFSSGFEGGMILLAAGSIIYAAVPRLLYPEPIEQVGLGLAVSVVASAINFGVSRILARAGKEHNSITLEADARHLMTDVWTTVGVLIGVVLVSLTGFLRLDPLIAILVACNILFTGFKLLRRSALGLMDVSLPEKDMSEIKQVLNTYEPQGLKFHALRTRTAGARAFAAIHILVPGDWSVRQAHRTADTIEKDMRIHVPNITVVTHIEPLDDPISEEDVNLDRV